MKKDFEAIVNSFKLNPSVGVNENEETYSLFEIELDCRITSDIFNDVHLDVDICEYKDEGTVYFGTDEEVPAIGNLQFHEEYKDKMVLGHYNPKYDHPDKFHAHVYIQPEPFENVRRTLLESELIKTNSRRLYLETFEDLENWDKKGILYLSRMSLSVPSAVI